MAASINSATSNTMGHIHADEWFGQLRVKIDYDWFAALYGTDPNTISFQIQQGWSTIFGYYFQGGVPSGAGAHAAVLNNCGDEVIAAYTDSDVCGSIEYVLPQYTDPLPYIYYASENKPPTYIYNAIELGNHPKWIKYSTE